MSDEIKIKSCPFCGSKEVSIIHTGYDDYTAGCEGCGTNGNTFGTCEEAENAWNRRARDE